MELTGAKLRRCGIPSVARISAAFFGSAAAAARPRVGAGGFGGAGALFKAPSACGASQPRGSRVAVSNSRWSPAPSLGRRRVRQVGPTYLRLKGAGPLGSGRREGRGVAHSCSAVASR